MQERRTEIKQTSSESGGTKQSERMDVRVVMIDREPKQGAVKLGGERRPPDRGHKTRNSQLAKKEGRRRKRTGN